MIKKVFIFFIITNFCFAQVDVVYNHLVWSDEFDYNGAINDTKWHHQTLLPNGSSWYNGEVQHYTNLLSNSRVENGVLKITAIKENYTNQGVTKPYTSARLNSKFAFTYGRVDIRAKIPTHQGTWPALWLLGKNITEPGGYFASAYGTTPWPACGEIDIMEHGIIPNQPTGFVQSAIHTPSSFGNTVNHGGIVVNNLGNDFHVYTMNWSPNQITFLLDGLIYYTYNPPIKNSSTWPFIADQYLLMNIAMGGVAGAIPSSFTQAIMEIDYVRIYQNNLSNEFHNIKKEFSFKNPVQDYLEIQSNHPVDEIILYDLQGKYIKTLKDIQNQIDIKFLDKGIYLMKIHFDEKVINHKLIKH